MRIVVIEDEDNTRIGIINLIRKLSESYEVVGEADNGEDGMRLIERTRPDLVFADIKMPQLSGIEMLEALKSKGHRHKTVILTGFSEYEYAKKALQLGVFEFLEKPITAGDLRATLEKAKQDLALQQIAGIPGGDASARLEHLLSRLVAQQDAIDPALLPTLAEQAASLFESAPLHLACVYLGDGYEANAAVMQKRLGEWLSRVGRYVVFAVPQEQTLVAIVQLADSGADFAGYAQRELLPAARFVWREAVISCSDVADLSGLKEGFDALRALRSWFIVIDGSKLVLTEAAVKAHACEPLPFPHTLESKLKIAITERKPAEAKRLFEDWLRTCFTGRFEPRHTIDVSVRLVTSVLQTIGELYGEEWVFHYQQVWLNPIMATQTRAELAEAFSVISNQIADIGQASLSAPYSLIVQKTVRLIHDRYQDGITLEEIASLLHITPEYLSGLFTKEVKSNFSAYVKDYRIRKAKTLLRNPELRMFEIARMVGYPDPKYFSRVFKEMTGLTPAEYQKLNVTG
ncbi:response regulator [Cohnella yongneupensis]|uniref:Response regulator n=1 Tax=Cohnella yongneupensis TaxID=425006 RepID=A0ABW0QYL8_9BACL